MRKFKCYQRIKNIVWPRGNFPACLWILWSYIYTALLGNFWLPSILDCPSVNACRWTTSLVTLQKLLQVIADCNVSNEKSAVHERAVLPLEQRRCP